MGRRTYPHLTIEDFGRQLIQTNDLDPIYIGLVEAKLDKSQLYRLLLSYWCFYDIGEACYLSEFEGDGYWNALAIACENKPSAASPIGSKNPVNGGWPRGKERRHFRGAQAMKGYDCLRSLFGQPEDAIVALWPTCPKVLPYSVLLERLSRWKQFGPWISYKIGDMLERVLDVPVEFEYAHVMYSEPYKAALMQWKVMHNAPEQSTIEGEREAVREVVHHLLETFSNLRAPPKMDRPIGWQEIETVLCKWKSHMNGSYPLWNDIDEINHGVAPWAKICTTAMRLQEKLPKRIS